MHNKMVSSTAVRQYHFLPRKYGRDLLLDIGRIETLKNFVLDSTPQQLSFYEILFQPFLQTASRNDTPAIQRRTLNDHSVFKMTMLAEGCPITLCGKAYFMIRQAVFVLLLGLTALGAAAQQLFVNSKTGDDAAQGTKAQPLKTIREAARRVNVDTTKGPTMIVLSAGVYLLTETVLFSIALGLDKKLSNLIAKADE